MNPTKKLRSIKKAFGLPIVTILPRFDALEAKRSTRSTLITLFSLLRSPVGVVNKNVTIVHMHWVLRHQGRLRPVSSTWWKHLLLDWAFPVKHSQFHICDRLRENPAYGIRVLFVQYAFLVAQVEICQSPDFVIYMSNNPPNCCRLLRRLVVLYKGEISLHFDPPSRHSRRTRSPLLWALIRILYLDTARFIDLLYVRSPF